MRTLPPLNALKSFEAAARLGGFSAAAAELRVTSAAVSQQVKSLEHFFGRQLFERRNNRIRLTDAGMTVLRGCEEPFNRLAEITEHVRERNARSRIVVSALGSVAEHWVTNVVAGFIESNPGTRVEIRIEEDPIDLVRDEIDLRISYGAHHYPELDVWELTTDRVTPVCGPDYLTRRLGPIPTPDMLTDDMLIHTTWGRAFASPPGWEEWHAHAGLGAKPDLRRGHRVGSTGLALDLACEGVGVALGQRMLASSYLETGRLVAPFEKDLALSRPYCIVMPRVFDVSNDVTRLRDWFKEAAA